MMKKSGEVHQNCLKSQLFKISFLNNSIIELVKMLNGYVMCMKGAIRDVENKLDTTLRVMMLQYFYCHDGAYLHEQEVETSLQCVMLSFQTSLKSVFLCGVYIVLFR